MEKYKFVLDKVAQNKTKIEEKKVAIKEGDEIQYLKRYLTLKKREFKADSAGLLDALLDDTKNTLSELGYSDALIFKGFKATFFKLKADIKSVSAFNKDESPVE